MKRINTFDGWKEKGRAVIKGQKAYLSIEGGECFFYENQTTPFKAKEDDECNRAKAFMRLFIK